MAYTPKYFESLDKVPVRGQDHWDPDEKEDLVKDAEAELEAAVNEGQEIRDPERIHGVAVKALATYYLVSADVSATQSRIGDLQDDGEQKEAYAQQFLDDYNRAVNAIINAEQDEGTESHAIVTVDHSSE